MDEASAPHRTPGVEDAAGVGAGRGAGEQAAPVGEGESGRGVRDAGSARENGAAVGGTGRAGDSESPVGESGREGGSSGGWSTERPAEDRVSTKPRRDRVKNKISNRELAAMYEDLQRMGRVPAESRRKTRRADGDATAGASGAGEAAASLPERPSQQGRRGSAAEAPAPKMKDALPADLEVMRKSILASMEVEEKEGVRRTRRAVSTPSRLTYGSSGQAERKAQFMARVPQGPKRPKVGAEHQAPEVAYTCPVSERPPLSDAERRYVSRVVYTPPDPAAEAPPAAPAPTPSRRGGVADRPPMQLDDRMRPKLESRVVAATDNDRALHRKLGTSLAAHLGFKGLGYQVCRSWAEDEIDKFRAGYDEYSDDLRMLRRHHLSGRSLVRDANGVAHATCARRRSRRCPAPARPPSASHGAAVGRGGVLLGGVAPRVPRARAQGSQPAPGAAAQQRGGGRRFGDRRVGGEREGVTGLVCGGAAMVGDRACGGVAFLGRRSAEGVPAGRRCLCAGGRLLRRVWGL